MHPADYSCVRDVEDVLANFCLFTFNLLSYNLDKLLLFEEKELSTCKQKLT